jgi:Fic family protein
MIHPFKDGNGRMARCLQTLVLVRENMISDVFTSIEEYLGQAKNTKEYYSVLAEVGRGSWNPQNNASSWTKFCLKAHYYQAHTVLKRTDEVEYIWSRLEDYMNKKHISDRSIYSLADAALGYRVTNSRYRISAEVEEQVARQDLRKLVEAGFLIPMGEARGRHYVASDLLKTIRSESRKITVIPEPFPA